MPYKDPEAAKAAKAAWYQKNKQEISGRQRAERNKKKDWITQYKLENSVCTDCKISYPPQILDFDHLKDKKFSISGKGVKDNTLDAIIKEIEKCEIVCANCHRHRTYMRSAAVTVGSLLSAAPNLILLADHSLESCWKSPKSWVILSLLIS